jgi:hypothetical protein
MFFLGGEMELGRGLWGYEGNEGNVGNEGNGVKFNDFFGMLMC